MFYLIDYEEGCQFVSASDYSKLPVFNGVAISEKLNARFEFGECGRKDCNFLYLTPGAFVCDETGKTLIQRTTGSCQLIPLDIRGQRKTYIVNVTNLQECLDLERSKIEFFKVSGRVQSIDRYVFHDEKISVDSPVLFKLPQTAASEILCNEAFRQAYELSNLSGLRLLKAE